MPSMHGPVITPVGLLGLVGSWTWRIMGSLDPFESAGPKMELDMPRGIRLSLFFAAANVVVSMRAAEGNLLVNYSYL